MKDGQLIYKSTAYEKMLEWKRKPWKYIEETAGIKLHWWQKIKLIYMGIVERWKDLMRVVNKCIK